MLFKRSLQLTVLLVVLELVVGQKKCSEDQYLNKKGKCRYCRHCPEGEGMNFTAKVPTNENGDHRSCPPCVPCPKGYYNDPEAGQYGCSECRLNCRFMNRKEYEECGGTKSGRCGACLDSSYEDRDKNIDSPCYKRNETDMRGIQLIEINDKIINENVGYQISRPDDNLTSKFFIGIAGGVGLLMIVFVVFSLVRNTLKRTRKRARQCPALVPSQSGTSLMESRTTLGHDNYGTGLRYEKLSREDIDLETDGPTVAHGEMENLQSSGPAGLPSAKGKDLKKINSRTMEKQRSYPNIVVKDGNPYFNHLAKHLFGHHVSEVFQALGVRDQTIFAELELYKLDRIKYEDAIYRLLLSWVRLKPKDATLAALCPILETFGLEKLINELLNLVKDENKAFEIIARQTDKSQTGNVAEGYPQPEVVRDMKMETSDIYIDIDKDADAYVTKSTLNTENAQAIHTSCEKYDDGSEFRSTNQSDYFKLSEENKEKANNLDSMTTLSVTDFLIHERETTL